MDEKQYYQSSQLRPQQIKKKLVNQHKRSQQMEKQDNNLSNVISMRQTIEKLESDDQVNIQNLPQTLNQHNIQPYHQQSNVNSQKFQQQQLAMMGGGQQMQIKPNSQQETLQNQKMYHELQYQDNGQKFQFVNSNTKLIDNNQQDSYLNTKKIKIVSNSRKSNERIQIKKDHNMLIHKNQFNLQNINQIHANQINQEISNQASRERQINQLAFDKVNIGKSSKSPIAKNKQIFFNQPITNEQVGIDAIQNQNENLVFINKGKGIIKRKASMNNSKKQINNIHQQQQQTINNLNQYYPQIEIMNAIRGSSNYSTSNAKKNANMGIVTAENDRPIQSFEFDYKQIQNQGLSTTINKLNPKMGAQNEFNSTIQKNNMKINDFGCLINTNPINQVNVDNTMLGQQQNLNSKNVTKNLKVPSRTNSGQITSKTKNVTIEQASGQRVIGKLHINKQPSINQKNSVFKQVKPSNISKMMENQSKKMNQTNPINFQKYMTNQPNNKNIPQIQKANFNNSQNIKHAFQAAMIDYDQAELLNNESEMHGTRNHGTSSQMRSQISYQINDNQMEQQQRKLVKTKKPINNVANQYQSMNGIDDPQVIKGIFLNEFESTAQNPIFNKTNNINMSPYRSKIGINTQLPNKQFFQVHGSSSATNKVQKAFDFEIESLKKIKKEKKQGIINQKFTSNLQIENQKKMLQINKKFNISNQNTIIGQNKINIQNQNQKMIQLNKPAAIDTQMNLTGPLPKHLLGVGTSTNHSLSKNKHSQYFEKYQDVVESHQILNQDGHDNMNNKVHEMNQPIIQQINPHQYQVRLNTQNPQQMNDQGINGQRGASVPRTQHQILTQGGNTVININIDSNAWQNSQQQVENNFQTQPRRIENNIPTQQKNNFNTYHNNTTHNSLTRAKFNKGVETKDNQIPLLLSENNQGQAIKSTIRKESDLNIQRYSSSKMRRQDSIQSNKNNRRSSSSSNMQNKNYQNHQTQGHSSKNNSQTNTQIIFHNIAKINEKLLQQQKQQSQVPANNINQIGLNLSHVSNNNQQNSKIGSARFQNQNIKHFQNLQSNLNNQQQSTSGEIQFQQQIHSISQINHDKNQFQNKMGTSTSAYDEQLMEMEKQIQLNQMRLRKDINQINQNQDDINEDMMQNGNIINSKQTNSNQQINEMEMDVDQTDLNYGSIFMNHQNQSHLIANPIQNSNGQNFINDFEIFQMIANDEQGYRESRQQSQGSQLRQSKNTNKGSSNINLSRSVDQSVKQKNNNNNSKIKKIKQNKLNYKDIKIENQDMIKKKILMDSTLGNSIMIQSIGTKKSNTTKNKLLNNISQTQNLQNVLRDAKREMIINSQEIDNIQVGGDDLTMKQNKQKKFNFNQTQNINSPNLESFNPQQQKNQNQYGILSKNQQMGIGMIKKMQAQSNEDYQSEQINPVSISNQGNTFGLGQINIKKNININQIGNKNSDYNMIQQNKFQQINTQPVQKNQLNSKENSYSNSYDNNSQIEQLSERKVPNGMLDNKNYINSNFINDQEDNILKNSIIETDNSEPEIMVQQDGPLNTNYNGPQTNSSQTSKVRTQQTELQSNRFQQSNSQRENNKEKHSSHREISDDQIQLPISGAKCLKYYYKRPELTEFEKSEILDFKQCYYLGLGAKKVHGHKNKQYNCGFDDERGDYNVVLQDHIFYRFQVLEFLGKGSFGQALKCVDHKTGEIVAIKIIRKKKQFQHQAGVELKILLHLRDKDPDDTNNIIRIKDYCMFRKHLVISFELFSINLYEFIKNNDFEGVSLSLIRRFAIQILQALKYLREQNLIHCDLKPENILLKSPDKSGIKVIDFGSSCFENERIYTYIQSRFYRAPEIILGIPYSPAIDMWSFGCILTELFTGVPLFPGEFEQEQLTLIMEVIGIPENHILKQATRKNVFFSEETNEPYLSKNSQDNLRIPSSKPLDKILMCKSDSFKDFISRCLEWDPLKRITPFEALMHEWIVEGLPPEVLIHHKKMLGISDSMTEEDTLYQNRQSIQNFNGTQEQTAHEISNSQLSSNITYQLENQNSSNNISQSIVQLISDQSLIQKSDNPSNNYSIEIDKDLPIKFKQSSNNKNEYVQKAQCEQFINYASGPNENKKQSKNKGKMDINMQNNQNRAGAKQENFDKTGKNIFKNMKDNQEENQFQQKQKPFGQFYNTNKSEIGEQQFDQGYEDIDFQDGIDQNDFKMMMGQDMRGLVMQNQNTNNNNRLLINEPLMDKQKNHTTNLTDILQQVNKKSKSTKIRKINENEIMNSNTQQVKNNNYQAMIQDKIKHNQVHQVASNNDYIQCKQNNILPLQPDVLNAGNNHNQFNDQSQNGGKIMKQNFFASGNQVNINLRMKKQYNEK